MYPTSLLYKCLCGHRVELLGESICIYAVLGGPTCCPRSHIPKISEPTTCQDVATSHFCLFFAPHLCLPHSRTPSAAALITHLAQQFSGFEDVESYEGMQVTFMRKAQALVLDLHARFASKDPRFAFSDIHALTGDSGGGLWTKVPVTPQSSHMTHAICFHHVSLLHLQCHTVV